jgi:hypothetical protein
LTDVRFALIFLLLVQSDLLAKAISEEISEEDEDHSAVVTEEIVAAEEVVAVSAVAEEDEAASGELEPHSNKSAQDHITMH